MSFVKEYTDLSPEGSSSCLSPEEPGALKVTNWKRYLKVTNCIFVNKTHDIKFIMCGILIKNYKIRSRLLKYIFPPFSECDVM